MTASRLWLGSYEEVAEQLGVTADVRARLVEATRAAVERGDPMPEVDRLADRTLVHAGRTVRVIVQFCRLPEWMLELDADLVREHFVMRAVGRARGHVAGVGGSYREAAANLTRALDADERLWAPRGSG